MGNETYVCAYLSLWLGYFEGKLVPYNQPKLVTGGILRSYQLEGMEWIKVCILQACLYIHSLA